MKGKTLERGDEQQTRDLALLKEIGQAINASLELEETLEAVLATTRRLIDYTAAEISLWERDSQSLVVCAQAGDPSYTAEAGGVYHLDEGYSGWAFDQEALDLLLIIAHQAATAVENARLYRRLREERDRLVRAQEEVRHELARSLHDGTVQRLASMAMGLEHIKRLWREKPQDVPGELDLLHKMAIKATEETRVLLFELRPVILETQGLVPALEAYLQQLPRYEGLEFHLTLVVTVEDDGRGFDVAAREKAYADGHFGLLNMRERARLIESDLSVTSTLGRGTKVVLRVPMEE